MQLLSAVPAFTLIALLTACGTRSADTALSASPDAAGSSSQAACREESIEHFLSRFENDATLQKQTTADPLEYGSIDTSAEPEPRLVMQRLRHHQIDFPLFPSAQAQAKRGLIRSIRKTGNAEAEVMLRKPDTDYQLIFQFQRNGCLKLIRKVDESL